MLRRSGTDQMIRQTLITPSMVRTALITCVECVHTEFCAHLKERARTQGPVTRTRICWGDPCLTSPMPTTRLTYVGPPA